MTKMEDDRNGRQPKWKATQPKPNPNPTPAQPIVKIECGSANPACFRLFTANIQSRTLDQTLDQTLVPGVFPFIKINIKRLFKPVNFKRKLQSTFQGRIFMSLNLGQLIKLFMTVIISYFKIERSTA